jgi:hypothetical protein
MLLLLETTCPVPMVSRMLLIPMIHPGNTMRCKFVHLVNLINFAAILMTPLFLWIYPVLVEAL